LLLSYDSVLISGRILIDQVLEFSRMSEMATWKRILENEEHKIKIQETFKQIDEHTKNFHVRFLHIPTYHQHIDAMFPSSNSC